MLQDSIFANLDELNNASPWMLAESMDWSCLTEGLIPKKYRRSSVIFYQGCLNDYVFLVKSGRVRVDVISQNGEEKTLFIADEGAFLGELSPIDGLPNVGCAVAVIDSDLYLIPKESFINEIKTNGKFALSLLALYTKKMRYLAENNKQLTFNNSYYRICTALMHLVRQYAIKTDYGYKISIRFTQKEMASLTGLSRVSVYKIMHYLTLQGIIKKEEGFFIIKNLDSILEYITKNE